MYSPTTFFLQFSPCVPTKRMRAGLLDFPLSPVSQFAKHLDRNSKLFFTSMSSMQIVNTYYYYCNVFPKVNKK